MEDDTSTGGEALSIDEAAAAYVRSTAPQEVEDDQTDDVEQDEGDTTDDELQASDENEEAGEEDEGEPGDEDQAEESDVDDDPESEQGRFVADNARVKLEDGTFATVAELKAGSLRNADYTRKTQEVAELRRSFETQSESVKQAEQQLSEQREYVTSLLQSLAPQAPDPSLLSTDPLKYLQDKANFESFQQHEQYLRGLSEADKAKAKEKSEADRNARMNSEWGKLLEKASDLNDKTKFQAFETEMIKFGSEAYGYSRDEILAQVPYDHRMALVLKDAIAWRKLQASKPQAAKKTEGRPPIHKGGKRLAPQAQKARQADAAITRLKSTGSLADATAAYLARQKG